MTIDIKGFGKLTGNKEAMNFLWLALDRAEEMYKLEGAEALAKQVSKVKDDIYETLEEKGYYKDVNIGA